MDGGAKPRWGEPRARDVVDDLPPMEPSPDAAHDVSSGSGRDSGGGSERDRNPDGEGRRTGCIIAAIVVLLPVALVAANLYSSLTSIGGPSGHEVRTDSRWASRDVTLTPETPRTVLTVVVTYPNAASGGASLTASAPRFGAFPAAISPTPVENPTTLWGPVEPEPPGSQSPAPFASSAPGSPALDPLVDPDVLVDVVPGRGFQCHAPCELVLGPTSCATGGGSCTSTFPVTVSLADAAGRGSVVVRVRAGITMVDASVPGGFKVEIRDGGTAQRPSEPFS